MASQPIEEGPPPAEEGYIHSVQLVCAYCFGLRNDHWLKKINDEQYSLISKGNFGRNNLYCRTCIRRMDRKLNRHKVKEQRKSKRSVHDTTHGTGSALSGKFDNTFSSCRFIISNNIEINFYLPASSGESQGRRNDDVENVPPNGSQPASTQGSSNMSAASQRNTQPGPSNQMMPPPPSRRFAVKSTGGRPKPYQTQPPTSRRPAASSAQPTLDPSSQSSTESSPMQPNYAAYVPASNRQGSANGSQHLSYDTPPASPVVDVLPGPAAPMPRNRPIRNQTPQPNSPPRQNETASDYRQRIQRIQREYFRGTAG